MKPKKMRKTNLIYYFLKFFVTLFLITILLTMNFVQKPLPINITTNNLIANEQKLAQDQKIIIQTPEETDTWAQQLSEDVAQSSFKISEKINSPFYIRENHFEIDDVYVTQFNSWEVGDIYASPSITPIDATGKYMAQTMKNTFPSDNKGWRGYNANEGFSGWKAKITFAQKNDKNHVLALDSFYLYYYSGWNFDRSPEYYGAFGLIPYTSSHVSNDRPTLFGKEIDFNLHTSNIRTWARHTYPYTIFSIRNKDINDGWMPNFFAHAELFLHFRARGISAGVYGATQIDTMPYILLFKIREKLNNYGNSYNSDTAHYFSSKKIIMSNNQIENYPFKETELKNMITLYDQIGNLIIPSRITFESVILDKKDKSLKINIRKITLNKNQWYIHEQFILPIKIVNLNYLLEGSVMSTSYWEHLSNGDTRYHSIRPKTRIRFSEQYIRALYIQGKQKEILAKLNSQNNDNWNFIGNDKQLAINQARALALNYENYENVKSEYQRNKDVNVLLNLKLDQSLNKYLWSNFAANEVELENYFYFFKRNYLTFDFGIENLTTYKSKITDFYDGKNLQITDSEMRNLDSLRTNWDMHIENLKIGNPNNAIFAEINYKFDLPNDVLANYDLKLAYPDWSEQKLVHNYLFQIKGLDISDRIMFVMEDGSILDQDFQVTHPSLTSKLKIGDYGYREIRYWTTFNNDQKEYLTLEQQSGSWYSPKYQKNVLAIDPSFNPKKIEYLFNQSLQMLISPYENSPGEAITIDTPQSFGIKKVIDIYNDNSIILEDWEDGKWSHANDENGIALYDGLFGADINGIFDSAGRLGVGKHNIKIELQNIDFEGVKNNFHLTIDKSPAKINVKPIDTPIQQLQIKDLNGDIFPLYYSNGLINFQVKDLDLRSIKAYFIDHEGHWYDMPIEIKSKKIDNQWYQTINSTIDYAGFMKIIITDQASNEQISYFWLEQKQGDVTPSFDFDTSLLLNDQKQLINNNELTLFKDLPTLRISSPLVTDLKIEREKLVNNVWIPEKEITEKIQEYLPANSDDYDFGKTIDSTQSVLKYAGDELKPFSTPIDENQWLVTNKFIKFETNGLFKITMKTRLVDNLIVEKYVYIQDGALNIIDESLLNKELSNFNPLPNTNQGDIDNIDQIFAMLKQLDIQIPNFLIINYEVQFSLLWYSSFNKINNPELIFNKEGKYKIKLEDAYGNTYDYQLLILNKDLKNNERDQNHLVYIYSDEADPENSAFWKGKVTWNFWRYEDADHAAWEKENFVREAMDDGLSREEAEWLYEHLKKDANWDGNLVNPDGSDFNFKNALQELYRDSNSRFNNKEKMSKGSLIGIIIGSVIGTIAIGGLIGMLILKRISGRKIK